METVALKLPESLNDDELLRMPAIWEEYLDVVDTVPYTVQFIDNELIMSQASRQHESLAAMIATLLNIHFIEQTEYDVLGSNVKIVVPGKEGDLNADVSVVREPVEYGLTPNGQPTTMRVVNPVIIVEVLSKSTRKFDLEEKLTYYKLIPSVQHILFVDQYRPFATVYSRTNVPDEWRNHDYRTLEGTVRLGETLALPMTSIYRKLTFQ